MSDVGYRRFECREITGPTNAEVEAHGIHTLVGILVPIENVGTVFEDCDEDESPGPWSDPGSFVRPGKYGYNPRGDAAVPRDFYTGKPADGTGTPVGTLGPVGAYQSLHGYNVEPFAFRPFRGMYSLGKYADAPWGEQRVGTLGPVGDYQSMRGYNAEAYTVRPFRGMSSLGKWADQPFGETPPVGKVGTLGPVGTYQSLHGYNVEPFAFRPFRGLYSMGKYADAPWGEQNVGAVNVGAVSDTEDPSAKAAKHFRNWADRKGYVAGEGTEFGWQATDNTAHGVLTTWDHDDHLRDLDRGAQHFADKYKVHYAMSELGGSDMNEALVIFSSDPAAHIEKEHLVSGMYDAESGSILVPTEDDEIEAIEGGFFSRLKEAFKKKKGKGKKAKKPKKEEEDDEKAEGMVVTSGIEAIVGAAFGGRRMMSRPSSSSAFRGGQRGRQGGPQQRGPMASSSSSSQMSRPSSSAQSPSSAQSQQSQAYQAQRAGVPSSAPASAPASSPGGGDSAPQQPWAGYDSPPPSFDAAPAPVYQIPQPQYVPVPQPVYAPVPQPVYAPAPYVPQPVYAAPQPMYVRGSVGGFADDAAMNQRVLRFGGARIEYPGF